ncbi:Variant SH3 domain containing protein [Brugia malayi]|uniref:BMA-FUT-8 n=1 Tax=Brugia malayi TaxID=6279 RepID=A0A0J9Y798_BRUMA|nr:Variant SH3 domain containing protein [Brugia malayi]CDQ03830.2 BMA-FUT-8 [Brugia malayi]VIO97550.1 Variant SH3 domain containing protein [Brugia malayi]
MKLRRTVCPCSMHCILISAVVIWSSIFFYLSFNLYGLQSKGKDINEERILALNYERALLDLAELKHENEMLRELLKDEKIEIVKRKKLIMKKQNDSNATRIKINNKFGKGTKRIERGKSEILNLLQSNGFSMKHEIARRELHNSIWELYYYLDSQLISTHNNNSKFINHIRNQLLSLLGQAAAFKNIDSAESWRANALANISAIFQNHFNKMQNPDDCKTARILTCDLNKQCGFGCQLHHVTYCFIVAYGSNRTLVLTDDGRTWNYAANGWNAAFLPITKCSFSEIFKLNENADDWGIGEHYKDKRIVKLPIIDSLSQRPAYLPLAIPQLYSAELQKLHSNSPAFFISQFIRYLMRPSAVFAKEIDLAVKKVPFDKGPIVGLQIRRTDKIHTEASFHDLDEYMKWAEDWFQIEEYRTRLSVKRRIYIATDDPEVFDEVLMKYPNYEIYGDPKISNMAQVHSRYTVESLIGIVIDIELLSRCIYLVCTFSSQVCRMGYELMQVRFGDAGDRFHSLDDIYYFGGQQAHEQVAVESYRAENDNEIDLKIGDIIGIAGNHWDGFSKGTNRRTGKKGLYPSYKAREKYITLDFP